MTTKAGYLMVYDQNGLLFVDGFEDAILGVDVVSDRVIYSVEKCIEILQKENDMSYDEAVFFLDRNAFTMNFGLKTPLWSMMTSK